MASKDVEEIVQAVKMIAPTFGGINLEDIAAPRCFEIEKRLKEELDIPVFHDDQHGTAIVAAAAMVNALILVDKKIDDIHVVVNGAGSAGIACTKLFMAMGLKPVSYTHLDVYKRQAIHFASPPYTSERAEDKVVRLLTQVSAYSGRMKMYTVPFTKVQELIQAKDVYNRQYLYCIQLWVC